MTRLRVTCVGSWARLPLQDSAGWAAETTHRRLSQFRGWKLGVTVPHTHSSSSPGGVRMFSTALGGGTNASEHAPPSPPRLHGATSPSPAVTHVTLPGAPARGPRGRRCSARGAVCSAGVLPGHTPRLAGLSRPPPWLARGGCGRGHSPWWRDPRPASWGIWPCKWPLHEGASGGRRASAPENLRRLWLGGAPSLGPSLQSRREYTSMD